MTRIEVRPGFFLNVETWGSGPPLVLLHGFTGSARSWAEFGGLLGRHYRCLAIDIVGHGASDAPRELEPYTMERAADDAAALARAAGAPRAAWLGYSMGGRTAIAVAARKPATVATLVTIGASPGIAGSAERAARVAADEALADRIEQEGIEAFVAYWEGLPLWETQRSLPEPVLAAQRAIRLTNRPHGLANSLRGMGAGAQADYREALRRLEMPFLALAGSLDSKYAQLAREMAAAAPRGASMEIEGAGHAAQLEAPGPTADAVLAFLHQYYLPGKDLP